MEPYSLPNGECLYAYLENYQATYWIFIQAEILIITRIRDATISTTKQE